MSKKIHSEVFENKTFHIGTRVNTRTQLQKISFIIRMTYDKKTALANQQGELEIITVEK